MPIDQIAFEVGLRSVSGFHRNFLLSYGMTPKQYREGCVCRDECLPPARLDPLSGRVLLYPGRVEYRVPVRMVRDEPRAQERPAKAWADAHRSR